MIRGHFYTTEEKRWLSEHIKEYAGYKELTAAFNAAFDADVTSTALQAKCSSLAIHIGAHHKWTEEQDIWLKSHIRDYKSFNEMLFVFNFLFGADTSKNALIKHCGILSLKMETNSGRIRAGENSGQGAPLGEEHIRKSKRGKPEIWVKVSDEVQRQGEWKGKYNRNWRLKSRVVWEQHNGKIPKGSKIIFLDSDPLNCEIENLYCITNNVHMMMVKNEWYGKDREITLTALKWCELNKTIKEFENG